MKLLPRETNLREPQEFSILYAQIQSIKKLKKGKKVDEVTKEEIREACREEIEPRIKEAGMGYAIFCDGLSQLEPLVRKGKVGIPSAINHVLEMKSTLLEDNQKAIDALMEAVETLLPKYPSCDALQELVQKCCECMHKLLEDRKIIAGAHFPWKKYPRKLMLAWNAEDTVAPPKNMEEKKERAEARQKEMAEIYPDGAPEEWAFLQAQHDLFQFERMFEQWLPSGIRQSTQDHEASIQSHLQLISNLWVAAGMVNLEILNRVYVARFGEDRPAEEIRDLIKDAKQPARLPPPPPSSQKTAQSAHLPPLPLPVVRAEQWVETFDAELEVIMVEVNIKAVALLEIVRDDLKLREEGKGTGTLSDEEKSRHTLRMIAGELELIVEALEYLEQTFIHKCKEALAKESETGAHAKSILSTIRYCIRIAVTAECHAQELTKKKYRFPSGQPKATGKTAGRVIRELEESEEVPEVDARELAELVASVQEAKREGKAVDSVPEPVFEQEHEPSAAEEEQHEGIKKKMPAAAPPAEPGKIKRSETFHEIKKKVSGFLGDAEQSMGQAESKFKLLKLPNGIKTLAGQIITVRRAMGGLMDAKNYFENAGAAMGSYEWFSPSKLKKPIKACEIKLEGCQWYLEDSITKPPKEDAFKVLEQRPQFRMKLLQREELLRDKGLVIFNVYFAPFSLWKGYEIQRPPIQLHYHIDNGDVKSFAQLFMLSEDELAKLIGTAHAKVNYKPDPDSEDAEEPETPEDVRYTYSNPYSAYLLRKWGTRSSSGASASSPVTERRLRDLQMASSQ